MKIREIIVEAKVKTIDRDSDGLPDSHVTATPGMKTHPQLDNSSPYAPWRFAAHYLPGAGNKDGSWDHEPKKDGPIGQKLVTVAYSEADEHIINMAEKKFGAKSTRITPNGSSEETDVTNTSPVPHNAGAKRNKPKN
jgi:hypothetical protein